MVLAVRDGVKYLGNSLDSIADQGIHDLEVILVDDGSNDDSALVAERHMLAPKVVRRPPRGQSAALNDGLHLASGRFISFLDCDDVWPSARLRHMLAAFERDTSLDCVFGHVINTDAELRNIGQSTPARMLAALLIRRAAALRIGDLRTDVAHGAIVDWISRAEGLGLKFAAIETAVLLRRIHGGNRGIRERMLAREDMLRVIRDHHARRKK